MQEIVSLRKLSLSLYNVSSGLLTFDLFSLGHYEHAIDFIGINIPENLFYVQFVNSKRFLYREVPTDVLNLFKEGAPESFHSIYAERVKGFGYYEVEQGYYVSAARPDDIVANFNKLMHHRDTTVGLWATDRPEKVDDPEKLLFQITY